jgi:hypothetical protein
MPHVADWMRDVLQDLKFELQDRPIAVSIRMAAFLLWTVAITLGTYAQFLLPRFWGKGTSTCYFTDALIIYIECREGPWGHLLNWAWFWTWGSFITIGFPPFWFLYGLPALVTLWLAVSLIVLLIRMRL